MSNYKRTKQCKCKYKIMAPEDGEINVKVKVPVENKKTINLKRKQPSIIQPATKTANVYGKIRCLEQASSLHFGWEIVTDNLFPTIRIFIPYIFRTIDNCKQKFVSIRMAEQLFLSKYLSLLHSDVYNICGIKCSTMTETEAHLFNEINAHHWDYKFGKILFNCNDLVITVFDASEFLNYLSFCYDKLKHNRPYPKKIGFVKINKNAVVPYVIKNNNQYLPSFYFDGELTIKTELVKWDFAYLKFCFNVQGIRRELYTSNSCTVVEFNCLKKMFPADTTFEEYWPDAKQTGRLWNTKAFTQYSMSYKLKAPFSEHATLPVFVSAENINFHKNLPKKINDPPPLIPIPPKASTTNDLQNNLAILSISNEANGFIKIQELTNVPVNPYKMSEIKLDNMIISSINQNPDPCDNCALILLEDFANVFCKSSDVCTIVKMFKALGVKMYLGNKLQMEVLRRNAKCKTIKDCVPLILLTDIRNYLPPIKYILKNGSVNKI